MTAWFIHTLIYTFAFLDLIWSDILFKGRTHQACGVVAALPPWDSCRSLHSFVSAPSITHSLRKYPPPLSLSTYLKHGLCPARFSLRNTTQMQMPRVVVHIEASYLALFVCFEDEQWPVDVILNQRYASRAMLPPPKKMTRKRIKANTL